MQKCRGDKIKLCFGDLSLLKSRESQQKAYLIGLVFQQSAGTASKILCKKKQEKLTLVVFCKTEI